MSYVLEKSVAQFKIKYPMFFMAQMNELILFYYVSILNNNNSQRAITVDLRKGDQKIIFCRIHIKENGDQIVLFIKEKLIRR